MKIKPTTYEKVINTLFFTYIIVILIFYFVLANSQRDVRMTYEREGFIALVNIIPLKTILSFSLGYRDFRSNVLIYNLLYPILIFIPYGFLLRDLLSNNIHFIQKFLFSILFIVVFMIIRTFTLNGYFDIDKVIMSLSGLTIGYILNELFVHQFIPKLLH
jgi:glycopeptide antibiotics resistance protein